MNEDIRPTVIGQMDNTIDHTFESANRVYDTDGIAPTLHGFCGGGHEPKVIVVNDGIIGNANDTRNMERY